MKSIITALLLSVSFGALAANDIDMKVEAALAAESRPQADRDARSPVERHQHEGDQPALRFHLRLARVPAA